MRLSGEASFAFHDTTGTSRFFETSHSNSAPSASNLISQLGYSSSSLNALSISAVASTGREESLSSSFRVVPIISWLNLAINRS
ncbi:hypothetical protein SDJN02_05762, partial [Cucurbita argyrosperma subsp. argyrosperma]